MFPMLNEPVTVAGRTVPVYNLLQTGSSIVFLAVLALICAVWLWRKPPSPVAGLYPFGRGAKWLAAAVAFAIPLSAAAIVFATFDDTLRNASAHIFKLSVNMAVLVVAAYSIVFRVVMKTRMS